MVLSAGLVLAANITLNVPMQEPVLPSAIVATEEVLGGQIDPNTGTTYRIVGGYEAIPGMFPWLANENRECGATLIASKYSLSLGYFSLHPNPSYVCTNQKIGF